MSSSDDDVIYQKEEYSVYYYGNYPVIDLTQDDAASPASPDITHISETELELDNAQSDTSGKYLTLYEHIYGNMANNSNTQAALHSFIYRKCKWHFKNVNGMCHT